MPTGTIHFVDPDCARCGKPFVKHSGGYPNTCPIISTYLPRDEPNALNDASPAEVAYDQVVKMRWYEIGKHLDNVRRRMRP